MASKIDPAELATINDLLKDFAVDKNMMAEEVYEISWTRFQTLEQIPFNEILESQWLVRLIKRPIYAILPAKIHGFLFDGLFTFAGELRSKDDPNQGKIYFGNQHAHSRQPKFHGDPPEDIKTGLVKAAWFLKKRAKDPLYNAVRFYQKFVNVHPFYDANGRIGRLIATTYLESQGIVLNWSEFDSKSKFIKKLNRCHLKPSEETFGYLVDYLREFTIPLDGLEEESTPPSR